MAKIPIAGFNQTIQGQISSIDTSIKERGSDYQQLSKLGDSVSQIGEQLLKKRFEAVNNDYLHTSSTEASLQLSDFARQDQIQNPNGFGHRQRVEQYADKFYQDRIKAAPSEDSALKFGQAMNQIGGRAALDAQQWSDKTISEGFVRNNFALDQKVATKHLTNPDIKSIQNDLAMADARWADAANNLVSQDEAARNRLLSKDHIAENFFDGLITTGTSQNSKDKNYASALSMLKDPNNKVANALDTNKRANMIAKIEARVEQDHAIKKADINSRVNNFVAGAVDKGSYDQNEAKGIFTDLQKVKTTPYEKQQIQEQMRIAVDFGKEKNKLNSMTAQELRTYEAPELPGDASTRKDRIGYRDKLQSMAGDVLKERATDISASFSGDPDIANLEKGSNGFMNEKDTQSLLNLRVSKAVGLGFIPDPFTKAEADTIHDNIVDAPSAEVAIGYVATLKQNLGAFTNGAFSKAFSKQAESAYAALPYMQTKEATIRLYNSIKNADENKKNFTSSDLLAIKSETQTYMRSDVMALLDSGDQQAGFASGLVQAVEINARKYLGKGPSTKEAVRKSYRDLIVDNFVYSEGGQDSTGSPRHLLVPQRSGDVVNTVDNISSFLNSYTGDGVKYLNIALDPKYKKLGVSEEGYINGVTQHGKWVLNDDMMGLTLVLEKNNGFDLVYNKEGNPIQKSFSEISVMPRRQKASEIKRNFK